MAQIYTVQPGDIIRANDINNIWTKLNTLEQRVTDLEKYISDNVDAVKITSLQPSDTIRVASELRVIGRNFEIPVTLNTVKIDGTPVERFKAGSGSQLLIFNIPSVVGILPREVILTVQNVNGMDSYSFTLQSALQIPDGDLYITEDFGTIGEITEGGTYIYYFNLNSWTNIGENYLLSAEYTNPVGTATIAQWEANTRIVDENGNALSSNTIRLESGIQKKYGVEITIPTGAESVNMSLRAESLNNPAKLSRTSSLVFIEIGEEQAVSDPRVTFTDPSWGVFSPIRKVTENNIDIYEVPYGGTAIFQVTANFWEGGSFQYSGEFEDPITGIWDNPIIDPTGGIKQSGNNEVINVTLTLQQASPAPGNAHPESNTLIIKVDNTGVSPPIHSFIRLPFRGYVLNQ